MAWVIEDRFCAFYRPGKSPIRNPRQAKIYAQEARANWTVTKLRQIDPMRCWHLLPLDEAVFMYEKSIQNMIQ